jgi:hypothetical protein
MKAGAHLSDETLGSFMHLISTEPIDPVPQVSRITVAGGDEHAESV